MNKIAINFLFITILTVINGFCSSVLFESVALSSLRKVNYLIVKQSVTSFRSFSNNITSYPFSTQNRFLSNKQTERFVQISNPCIDGVFQYGFSEPSILSDFINSALSLEGKQSIEDIQYIPKDMASSDPVSSLGYHFTVDVRCRTKEGKHFLVEMQNDFRDDYHFKSLVEHSRMLSRLDIDQNMGDQVQREENNKNDKRKFWKGIQGLYTIVITNKAFPFYKMKNYNASESVMEPFLVNPYELRHTKQLDRHYGDVPNQIVLLMLNNLTKSDRELSTNIERWAYLFKDSSLKTGVRKIVETKDIYNPEVIAGPDKAITAFIDRVNIKNLPHEVRDRYISSINYYNTTIIDIEDKAIEKGKYEERIKIALKMIFKQKSNEDIVELSGITPEELEELKRR